MLRNISPWKDLFSRELLLLYRVSIAPQKSQLRQVLFLSLVPADLPVPRCAKKKNLSAAWLENYFPLAADHQRGYSKQILLHRQRNERTSLASSDIYFYCCCRWNKCKKRERNLHLDNKNKTKKQKSNNKETKREDKSQGFLPMGVMFLCLQPIHHENNWSWWSFVYSI